MNFETKLSCCQLRGERTCKNVKIALYNKTNEKRSHFEAIYLLGPFAAQDSASL